MKNINVSVDGVIIGAVQTISEPEPTIMQNGFNFDAYRILFDKSKLTASKIFNKDVIASAAQNKPLQLSYTNDNGDICSVENAWLVRITSYSYITDSNIIVESCNMTSQTFEK